MYILKEHPIVLDSTPKLSWILTISQYNLLPNYLKQFYEKI